VPEKCENRGLTEGFAVGVCGDGADINQNPDKSDNGGDNQYGTDRAAQELNNRLFRVAGVEVMNPETAQENCEQNVN